MPGQLALPGGVRDDEVVEVVDLARSGEHHDRQPAGYHLEVLGRHGLRQHGEAVHPPRDLRHEALRPALQRRGDQQGVAVAAGRPLHAADDLVGVQHRGVVGPAVVLRVGLGVRVGVVGEAEAQHPGGAAGQPPGVAARYVAQLAGCLQHPLAGLGAHRVGVAVDPGDRGDRDARPLGDVVHRGGAHSTDRPLPSSYAAPAAAGARPSSESAFTLDRVPGGGQQRPRSARRRGTSAPAEQVFAEQ